jgi:hypothetical protein
MKHDWIRFRLVLPLVFGFLSAVLMTWDYENNCIVGLMGMGGDMGPPFWPYQAIYLLLLTINAPAFVLSMPILKMLNLQTLSLQYDVWFVRPRMPMVVTLRRSACRPSQNYRSSFVVSGPR